MLKIIHKLRKEKEITLCIFLVESKFITKYLIHVCVSYHRLFLSNTNSFNGVFKDGVKLGMNETFLHMGIQIKNKTHFLIIIDGDYVQ